MMDIVTESELATMVMMSGGGNNFLDIYKYLEKYPVLYTYKAKEFTFEFKIPIEPMFTEYSHRSNEEVDIFSPINAFFICKKGTQIICVNGALYTTYNNLSRNVHTYNSDNILTYSLVATDVTISSVFLRLDYNKYPSDFVIQGDICNHYNNYTDGIEGDNTTHFVSAGLVFNGYNTNYCILCTPLSNAEFMNTYSEAMDALIDSATQEA